jgi:hypothetical protein
MHASGIPAAPSLSGRKPDDATRRMCGPAEERVVSCAADLRWRRTEICSVQARRGEASRGAGRRHARLPARRTRSRGSASRRAPREKIMRPASLVRTDGRIRQPPAGQVRACQPSSDASQHEEAGVFLATSPSDPPLSSLDLFSRSVKKKLSRNREDPAATFFFSLSSHLLPRWYTRVQPATDHVSVSHTPTPPSLSNF